MKTPLRQRLRRLLGRDGERGAFLRTRPTGGPVLALGGLGAGALNLPPSRLSRFDGALVGVVLALTLLGLVMVYSASITLADASGGKLQPTHYLMRHLAALAAAGVAAAIAFSVPLAIWQRLAPYAFGAAIVLLALSLVPGIGRESLGARRWIVFGPLSLQPSELMKLAFVLYTASFTVRKQDYMHSFIRSFGPIGLLMGVTGGLLLLQPDLGALVVIVAIGLGILFLGGVSMRQFTGVSAMIGALILLMIWLTPWRRARVFAYFDPCAPDQVEGKGYQLCTSLISFARGDWFGVGLGGSVTKLQYLPEAHTDFILAVLGEELGLVGVLTVIVLYYWLVKRAFEIGRQAVALERSFAGLVAQGIGLWIGVQAFINMGVATGLLPTKGLTLPLMSYGGSALLATIVGLAVLLRVDFENRCLMRGGRA